MGWSAAPLEWVQIVRGRRPKSKQWPLAPGHSQYRTAQGSQQHKIGSGVKRVSMPRLAERPVGATVVRERKTPEQARSEASTRVSRLQAAYHEAKKRMLVADEKIRLAQVALQDAMDDKEYDLREVLLAEARLERVQKKLVPPRQTPPASAVSNLEAEVQRLRTQLAQVQAAQMPNVGRHPPPSSVQAADMLRERAIPTDQQDLEFFQSEKHLELRDVIQFGDQESILSVTPHPPRGGTAPHATFHGHQRGVSVRNIRHRCGFCGCRVGEASN